jgi:[acyl-carrier-protein] S-malonyltransferase
VAGVLNFEQAVKLVRLRGSLMQQACDENEGTMASIMGLEEETVRGIVAEANKVALVDVANVNCPGQIVVSGTKAGVQKAIELADAKEAKKIVELTVAGAFHSRLMQSARKKLEEALKTAPLKQPKFPVHHNVTGEATRDVETIRRLLGEQVTSSVLWEKCLRQMIASGVNAFLEIGAGRVLVGLLKRTDKEVAFANVEDLKSLEKAQSFVEELKAKK